MTRKRKVTYPPPRSSRGPAPAYVPQVTPPTVATINTKAGVGRSEIVPGHARDHPGHRPLHGRDRRRAVARPGRHLGGRREDRGRADAPRADRRPAPAPKAAAAAARTAAEPRSRTDSADRAERPRPRRRRRSRPGERRAAVRQIAAALWPRYGFATCARTARVCNAGITRARQHSPCRGRSSPGDGGRPVWPVTRRPGSRRITLLVGASIAAIALAGGPVAAEEEGGERNLPIEFVHNNLEEAPVAGAVWAAGPALKNGDADLFDAAHQRRERQPQLRGHGSPQRDDDRGQPHRPRQPDRRRQRLPARDQPGRPRRRLDPVRARRSRSTAASSWTVYPIRTNSTYQATGDPAVAFDAAGNAYYATLGFRFVGPANAQNPDILVSVVARRRRHLGRRSASRPGSGNFGTSVGDLLDKEYVAAWGNGNAVVTWGDFRLGQKGVTESITPLRDRDPRRRRDLVDPSSRSRAIARSRSCPVPMATADGRLFAAFENFPPELDNGRDDYEVVELDPGTGRSDRGPVHGRRP